MRYTGAVRARVLLALLGLALPLLLVEGALRVLASQPPAFWQPDPDLGGRLRPGAQGWWTEEGRGWVSVNREGFRDRDHALTKPAGIRRIAVLGDSYVEAVQVNQDQTFWSVAERACPATEVLAFGVSGYGTRQERILYERFARAYRPDITVLAVTVGNDVSDADPSLLPPPRRSAPLPLPAFVPFWSERGSALAALAQRAAAPHVTAEGVAEQDAARAAVYSAPDARWEGAWRRVEAEIRALDGAVAADGGRLVLLLVSDTNQWAGRVADPAYPNHRLAALGLPTIDTLPAMRTEERAGRHPHGWPNGGGHWNPHGHAVAGALLAAHLCHQVSP